MEPISRENLIKIITGLGAVIIALVVYVIFLKIVGSTCIEISGPTPLPTADHLKAITQKFDLPESGNPAYSNKKVSTSSPDQLPASTSFQKFTYNQNVGKFVDITGSCTDAFYTIEIFKSSDDYIKNPKAAVISNTSNCPPPKLFQSQFNLQDYKLPSGDYYFFVADKGRDGVWYNPR